MAMTFYQKSLALFKAVGDKKGLILNRRKTARLHIAYADFSSALEDYKEALTIAKKIQDTSLTIIVYKEIGDQAIAISNYPMALGNFHSALNLCDQTKDYDNTGEIFCKIGWIYRDVGKTERSLEFLNKALDHFKKAQNQQGVANVLSMIGNVYMNSNEYEKSLEYYTQSSEIKRELNDEIGLASNYANIAFLYQLLYDYSSALKYHDSSFRIFNKHNDKYGTLLYYKDIGHLIQIAPDSILKSINIKPSQRYQAAIEYESHALKLAQELNNFDQIEGALQFLISTYKKMGDYKSAFFYLKTSSLINDSIRGKSTIEEIVQREMQYAFDKKEAALKAEQEKKDIRQRNIRFASFSTVIALLLFSSVVLYQQKKVKQEKQRSDKLLLNILPEEVAQELKEKGSAAAKQFDDVSVLFTDFVHFTQTTEQLSPQQLVQELNDCFTAFDKIIERNGLEKIKTVGDAYIAVCGLPTYDPRHAHRTVKAALEIRN